MTSPSLTPNGRHGRRGVASAPPPLVGRRGRERRGRRSFPELLPLVAPLLVDNGGGFSNAGFAGSVLTQCPLRLSAGPSCWTSWLVWTRFTVFALVVDSGCGFCRACFASISPRAVFLFVVVWPEMPCIMAGMDQIDSYAVSSLHGHPHPCRGAEALPMVQTVLRTIALFFLLLSSGPDARHLGRYGPEGQVLSMRVWARSSTTAAVACFGLVLLVMMHLTLSSLWSSAGPGCSASWPVWSRGTVSLRVVLTLLFTCPLCATTGAVSYRVQKTADFPQLEHSTMSSTSLSWCRR